MVYSVSVLFTLFTLILSAVSRVYLLILSAVVSRSLSCIPIPSPPLLPPGGGAGECGGAGASDVAQREGDSRLQGSPRRARRVGLPGRGRDCGGDVQER